VQGLPTFTARYTQDNYSYESSFSAWVEAPALISYNGGSNRGGYAGSKNIAAGMPVVGKDKDGNTVIYTNRGGEFGGTWSSVTGWTPFSSHQEAMGAGIQYINNHYKKPVGSPRTSSGTPGSGEGPPPENGRPKNINPYWYINLNFFQFLNTVSGDIREIGVKFDIAAYLTGGNQALDQWSVDYSTPNLSVYISDENNSKYIVHNAWAPPSEQIMYFPSVDYYTNAYMLNHNQIARTFTFEMTDNSSKFFSIQINFYSNQNTNSFIGSVSFGFNYCNGVFTTFGPVTSERKK
jgi:hypothetical protein